MLTSDRQPFPVNGEGLHKLYDPEQFTNAIADVIQVMQANRVEPLKAMVLALEQRGPYRLLSPLLTRPWMDIRDLLESNYPHFAEVIEPVKQAWHLAYHSQTAFSLPPLLLLGEPGIGKTHFTAQLAKCINIQYLMRSMATLSAGFVLSGMDARWEDARPGMIFTQLMHGDTANPLVVLDEIDKVAGDRYHDPLGPLYGLLESETARTFTDEYLPVPLDAGRINWIATANRIEDIPEPIVSRMRVIEVPKPDYPARVRIAYRLYAAILKERLWGKVFSRTLPQDVAERLAEIGDTPRAMRQALEEACGKASVRVCALTRERVFGVCLRPADLDTGRTAVSHGFGFIPHQKTLASTEDAPAMPRPRR
ncbi:AAA family ATPase [Acidithiobacillus sp. MC6.1]|nr:AAA family ATPase [Acidithiobacillus sp. MC6.1]